MPNINLVRKLTIGIVALTSLLVAMTTISIGFGIFFLTEQRVKANMLEDARKILTEYITVSDDEIKQKVQSDQTSLGTYLRSKDLSLLITSQDGNAIAKYGIYHDLSKEYLEINIEDESRYFDKKIPDVGYVDTYTLPVVSRGRQYGYMQILRRNREADILGSTTKTTALVLLPFSWSLALLLGWVMAKRITRPISKLVKDISNINPEELKEIRADKNAEEEIKVMTYAVNELIGKLASSYKRQSQLAENISHEFKTPLTRITSNLQVRRVKEAEKEALALGANVDALLSLALWEKDENVKCDVNDVISNLTQELPEEIRLVVTLPEKFEIGLTKSHAKIILRNIIDNAVKHNKTGGFVKIMGNIKARKWEIKITNSVTKIPNVNQVVKRGYKGVASQGSGIGMAIVKDLCKLYELNLKIVAGKETVSVTLNN